MFYTPHKNPLKSKLIQALLSLSMAFTMVLPAVAETTDIAGSAIETTTQTIDIYVTKGAGFSVKLPVSVTLAQSNGIGTADYSIFVKGDVEDGSSVTVGPQADIISFKKTKGDTSTTLTGSIIQAEDTIAAADIGSAYPGTGQLSGSVSVSGLTAGMWKGQMTFLIGYTAPSGGGNEPLNATALMDNDALWTAVGELTGAITFTTSATIPDDTASSTDISAAKDGSVMAYTLNNGDTIIGAEGGVLAPENMDYAFSEFYTSSIDCYGLDTRNVTSMNYMFGDCEDLTKLNVSNIDTSKVENFESMFEGCSNLVSLNVSGFDTSNATNFRRMFASCKNLMSIDVSGFDTSKATNLSRMFVSCTNLKLLNVNTFNTANVTDMNGMFNGCSSLSSLNLSNFNTGKTTDMSYMFGGCRKLTSLDLSSFNTQSVTGMSSMFSSCSSLTSLDLSNFNTSNVTNMGNMFSSCSLTTFDLSGFNTSNVKDMGSMFLDCPNLTTLDLSNFDTSKLENSTSMFQNCPSLTSLNLNNFNTGSIIYTKDMFYGSPNVTAYVSDSSVESWLRNTVNIPSTAKIIIGSMPPA